MTILVYCILFGVSLGVSLALTNRSIVWAERWGVLDQPGERKVHSETKPRLGGLGICGGFYLTLIGAVSVAWFFPPTWLPDAAEEFLGTHRPGILREAPGFIGMVAAGAVMFTGGLLDDRRNLSPKVKLLWQLAASGILIASGYYLDFYKVIWNHALGFWLIGLPVTLFWMLFLINAFNLLDNMDGLSAGVAAITTSFFAVYAHLQKEFFLAASMCCLIGALIGFLRYNWNPSRIFMGDGGALLVGLLIAAFSCQCTYYKTPEGTWIWRFFAQIGDTPTEQGIISLLTPLVIMAVPIFDTTTVVLIRLKNRRPIMVGDTNHFSHRLVALGLGHTDAVRVIYLATTFTGLGALILRTASLAQAVFVFFQVLSVFGMITVLEWGRRRTKPAE